MGLREGDGQPHYSQVILNPQELTLAGVEKFLGLAAKRDNVVVRFTRVFQNGQKLKYSEERFTQKTMRSLNSANQLRRKQIIETVHNLMQTSAQVAIEDPFVPLQIERPAKKPADPAPTKFFFEGSINKAVADLLLDRYGENPHFQVTCYDTKKDENDKAPRHYSVHTLLRGGDEEGLERMKKDMQGSDCTLVSIEEQKESSISSE